MKELIFAFIVVLAASGICEEESSSLEQCEDNVSRDDKYNSDTCKANGELVMLDVSLEPA
ncbi:hypothetical protein RUM44_010935 [Polyplax serrata]|uniref:Uncharacterized protein n=1 Tax=Polyplax serrata TaxID=468196 RepID=A0ABR1APA3_POLSC